MEQPRNYNPDLPSLVLGGGGTFGIGWESGILDEFRDRGANRRDAQILGTSAGSWVGGFIATGKTFEDITSRVKSIKAPNFEANYLSDMAYDIFGDAKADNVSAVALRVPSPSQLGIRALVKSRGSLKDEVLPRADMLNGGEHGLAAIAAASSAVPFIFSPVKVGDHYYVDGGVRSIVSADLAPKSQTVLALACLTRHFAPPVGPIMEIQLHRELGKWEKQHGGKVVYVRPNKEISDLVKNPIDCFSVEIGKRAYELARMQASRAFERRESWSELLDKMRLPAAPNNSGF